MTGHYQKAGVAPSYHLKEFRLEDPAEMEPGQEVTLTLFKPGDIVDVTGVSKGKGFGGVMKRHGFRGANASRGTHEYFRHGGSVGANSFPAHVFKGHRMPGHYGDARVTIQNITVMDVKEDQNLILLRGGLPGSRHSLVLIRRATKKKAASSASE
jgi:large subunit ribosomal protein L3